VYVGIRYKSSLDELFDLGNAPCAHLNPPLLAYL
jgi:hypothetical protein